jgi:hypothetical protein
MDYGLRLPGCLLMISINCFFARQTGISDFGVRIADYGLRLPGCFLMISINCFFCPANRDFGFRISECGLCHPAAY